MQVINTKQILWLFIVSVLLQEFCDSLSNFSFCNIYVGYNFSNKCDYAISFVACFPHAVTVEAIETSKGTQQ
jgi:hypothetical protein